MSKSIMIVICDFLLLSLLSLANFENPVNAEEEQAKKQQAEVAAQQRFADSQLLDLLKLSLDNERDKRMALSGDVERLSEAAKKNQEMAVQTKQMLAQREAEISRLADTKKALEAEKAQILVKSAELEKRVADSEQRNTQLQSRIVSVSANLEESAATRARLEKQLGEMKDVDSTTKLKLERVQAELKQHKENLEKLRAESEVLKNENRAIELEKNALATQLEVASTKTKIYEENLKRFQTIVDVEKTEKEKMREHAENLAAGVSELAASQKEISGAVREMRPKTSSEIFEGIRKSFVRVVFNYKRNGLLGLTDSSLEFKSIPVKIGADTWLIFVATDTMLSPSIRKYYPPENMNVSVLGKAFRFQPNAIYSVGTDPRLLAIKVPAKFCENEKIEAIALPSNFFAFSDCVVVDPDKSYYGQVPFRADFKDPSYAQMDVGLLQSVFGTFAPSDGDLVFSRNGEFMGLMLGGDVAVLLKSFGLSRALPVGKDYTPSQAESFVGDTSNRLKKMPFSLR